MFVPGKRYQLTLNTFQGLLNKIMLKNPSATLQNPDYKLQPQLNQGLISLASAQSLCFISTAIFPQLQAPHSGRQTCCFTLFAAVLPGRSDLNTFKDVD